jgi:hypothetical protein
MTSRWSNHPRTKETQERPRPTPAGPFLFHVKHPPQRLTEDRPTLFFAVPTFFAALLTADLPRRHVRLGTQGGVRGVSRSRPGSTSGSSTGSGSRSSTGSARPKALHIFLSSAPA